MIHGTLTLPFWALTHMGVARFSHLLVTTAQLASLEVYYLLV